jgi:hypothetical protein
MEPKRWARVRLAGAHGLRRGAWYPVVNDKKPTIVFLDVNKRNVAVDRTLLEFSETKPTQWSVVVRDANERGTQRASAASLNRVYAVCPRCRARTNLDHGERAARCPVCAGEFEVDWQHRC